MKALALTVMFALRLFLAPLAAEAQQPGKVARIGVLYPGSPAAAERWRAMLLQGLHDLGYVEGQNITFTYRYAEEKPERLPALAAELVQLPVDVIVAGPPEAVQAAKQVTSTIPIVMVTGGPDPQGFQHVWRCWPAQSLYGRITKLPPSAGYEKDDYGSTFWQLVQQ